MYVYCRCFFFPADRENATIRIFINSYYCCCYCSECKLEIAMAEVAFVS